MSHRHALIQQLAHQECGLSVRQLCECLGISRSWYYQAQTRCPDEEEVALRAAIEEIICEFAGYGYRRVTRALQRAGWHVNHKHVLRIMREESLLCQLKRQFVVTTNSQHALRCYPNLLVDLELTAPNQLWQADITYIRLRKGFVYLAALLDAYSRMCVGWHLSRFIDGKLALAALDMALSWRRTAPGLIHHSDRGVQYANHEYVARLQAIQARISMTTDGDPYQNAKAERFFRTLKQEEVYLNDYATLEEAQSNITHFIQQVYNSRRLHSSLGYLPPAEFEQLHFPPLQADTLGLVR